MTEKRGADDGLGSNTSKWSMLVNAIKWRMSSSGECYQVKHVICQKGGCNLRSGSYNDLCNPNPGRLTMADT